MIPTGLIWAGRSLNGSHQLTTSEYLQRSNGSTGFVIERQPGAGSLADATSDFKQVGVADQQKRADNEGLSEIVEEVNFAWMRKGALLNQQRT